MSTKQAVHATEPGGISLAFGLAVVRGSLDPTWPRWAVLQANRKTCWFKSRDAAQRRADKLNGRKG